MPRRVLRLAFALFVTGAAALVFCLPSASATPAYTHGNQGNGSSCSGRHGSHPSGHSHSRQAHGAHSDHATGRNGQAGGNGQTHHKRHAGHSSASPGGLSSAATPSPRASGHELTPTPVMPSPAESPSATAAPTPTATPSRVGGLTSAASLSAVHAAVPGLLAHLNTISSSAQSSLGLVVRVINEALGESGPPKGLGLPNGNSAPLPGLGKPAPGLPGLPGLGKPASGLPGLGQPAPSSGKGQLSHRPSTPVGRSGHTPAASAPASNPPATTVPAGTVHKPQARSNAGVPAHPGGGTNHVTNRSHAQSAGGTAGQAAGNAGSAAGRTSTSSASSSPPIRTHAPYVPALPQSARATPAVPGPSPNQSSHAVAATPRIEPAAPDEFILLAGVAALCALGVTGMVFAAGYRGRGH